MKSCNKIGLIACSLLLLSGCVTRAVYNIQRKPYYPVEFRMCEGKGIAIRAVSYEVVKKDNKEDVKLSAPKLLVMSEENMRKCLGKENKVLLSKMKPVNPKKIDLSEYKPVDIDLTPPYKIKNDKVYMTSIYDKRPFKYPTIAGYNYRMGILFADGTLAPAWKKGIAFLYIPSAAIDIVLTIPQLAYEIAFGSRETANKFEVKSIDAYECDGVRFSEPLDVQRVDKEYNFKRLKPEWEKLKSMIKPGDTVRYMERRSNLDGFGAYAGFALIRDEQVVYTLHTAFFIS